MNTAVTAVALLQERVIADLLSPRQGLNNLDNAAAVTRLVWTLAEYVTAWQSDHCSSLQLVYRGCCRLLHTATALLMRPSLLTSLAASSDVIIPAEQDRCRDRRQRCNEDSLKIFFGVTVKNPL